MIRKIQEYSMDINVCIFRTKNSRCKSTARKNLPLLICEHHLKLYLGLEVGYVKLDGDKKVGMVGGFLKPVIGKMITRSTVVVPSKVFFDLKTRPAEINVEQYNTVDGNLELNSSIATTVKQYATKFLEKIEERQVIEMFRNFIGIENVDPGPDQKDEFPGLQANVESLKVRSNVHIRNQPVSKAMLNDGLYVETNDGQRLLKTSNMQISSNFQYFLSNCLFSEMRINVGNNYFVDYLHPNLHYVQDVGLVATEDIMDPNFLILDGRSSGSLIYYQSHIGLMDKIIQESQYSLTNFPKENALNEAWKGGLCP